MKKLLLAFGLSLFIASPAFAAGEGAAAGAGGAAAGASAGAVVAVSTAAAVAVVTAVVVDKGDNGDGSPASATNTTH